MHKRVVKFDLIIRDLGMELMPSCLPNVFKVYPHMCVRRAESNQPYKYWPATKVVEIL